MFQKQSGLINVIWNRGCAWRGANDALFIYTCISYWVVVLSRCRIRGVGSTFYFKNAQWPNLQQQFWIWVFEKDLPRSFVHWCAVFQQLWALPVQHSMIGYCRNEGSCSCFSLWVSWFWPVCSQLCKLGPFCPFWKRWTSTFSTSRCWQSHNLSSKHSFNSSLYTYAVTKSILYC